MKEVRLTIDHARYLKWLFPESRFLFVYRDLYDAYRSCKGVNWLNVWPDYRVSPPLAFAHHWRHLLEGFLEGYESLGGMLVRYEDLVEGRLKPETIATQIGVSSIDVSLLGNRVGSRQGKRQRVGRWEKLLLRGVAGDLMDRVGYRP